MKTCVFAGSFDPFTIGHEYVVDSALKSFDKVIIALGENVDKEHMFSLEQRKDIIKACYVDNEKVEIATFDGMLVDFMKKMGVYINVRGIRDIDDYKYETTMTKYNTDAYPELITFYIPTPKDFEHVSSTAMRNILKINGKVENYIPKKAVKLVKELAKTK